MYEGKNMGIMITLKKTYPRKDPPPLWVVLDSYGRQPSRGGGVLAHYRGKVASPTHQHFISTYGSWNTTDRDERSHGLVVLVVRSPLDFPPWLHHHCGV